MDETQRKRVREAESSEEDTEVREQRKGDSLHLDTEIVEQSEKMGKEMARRHRKTWQRGARHRTRQQKGLQMTDTAHSDTEITKHRDRTGGEV